MVTIPTLQQFPPVVSLLILNGSQTRMGDMLRCILFDLVHRNILEVTTEETPSNGYTSHYVKLGKAGEDYIPLPYEEIFLQFFHREADAKLLVQTVVKLAVSQAIRRSDFQQMIIRQPTARGQFQKSLWHAIFGGFTLSDAGVSTLDRMQKELVHLSYTLKNKLTNDPATARELIHSLGAYALLVPGIDLLHLQLSVADPSQAFAGFDQPRPAYANSGGGCGGGTSGCSSWETLSGAFDASDHGGGHGGGADSGCGGDGGCGGGGCGGGCGGCGGCGG